MSKELMVVDQPDFLDQAGLDAPSALRCVYRRYGFRLSNEIPAQGRTYIVAAQTAGQSAPEPVSRDDYFANPLDPVRGKVSAWKEQRMRLGRFARKGNMLVFFFDPES